jgi:hypothetical protein
VSQVQPGCYYRCGRKAAVGKLFCSKACAGEWAETMAEGNEDEWCPICKDWVNAMSGSRLTCRHLRTGLKHGMKHNDASEQYTKVCSEETNKEPLRSVFELDGDADKMTAEEKRAWAISTRAGKKSRRPV